MSINVWTRNEEIPKCWRDENYCRGIDALDRRFEAPGTPVWMSPDHVCEIGGISESKLLSLSIKGILRPFALNPRKGIHQVSLEYLETAGLKNVLFLKAEIYWYDKMQGQGWRKKLKIAEAVG
jgi:hypothetical protein